MRALGLSAPRGWRSANPSTHNRPLCLPLLFAWLITHGNPSHALTPLAALRFSPDITVNFAGTLVTLQNVAQDNLAGSVSLVNIGTIPPGTDVIAYHLPTNGEQLLSFDTTVTIGPMTANKEDLVRLSGATCTLFFNGGCWRALGTQPRRRALPRQQRPPAADVRRQRYRWRRGVR